MPSDCGHLRRWLLIFALLFCGATSSQAGWIIARDRARIAYSTRADEGHATFAEPLDELATRGPLDGLSLSVFMLIREEAFQKELFAVLERDAPRELKAALQSAGNMHNPKVLALIKPFTKALLATPTFQQMNTALAPHGLCVSRPQFEKFEIRKHDTGPRFYCFLTVAVTKLPDVEASPNSSPADGIDQCDPIIFYKVAPYLALAAKLQSLPKDEATARLRQWADSGKYNEQIILLCRMLFDRRPGVEFREPMLGEPQFYGETTAQDWPLEPITEVDDIPFLIVITYILAGHAEEAPSYLSYCLSNADWTARHYQPVSRQKMESAFQTLVKSPVWKRPLNAWELSQIQKQLE